MQSQPESPRSATPGEPQQDPELWFEDGNVVIVAGNGAFCVHTGVLSRHSEVFQNMFGVPQPALPAPSDVFNGQPVVHVSDSAHDFKQLLHILYDGVRFMPPNQPVAFRIVAAAARLGHKYHIDWVLEEAKRRLRSVFRPASYDAWLDFWHHGSRNQRLVEISSSHVFIEAINLIQRIGAADMLPVAIYECCRSPSTLLFHGTKRADGTAETLDLPTLEQCFNAHAMLIQRQSRLNAQTFCAGPSESCQRQLECGEGIKGIYRDRVCNVNTGTPPANYFAGNPMGGLICSLIWRSEAGGMICFPCGMALTERDEGGRRAIWRDLPSITGVPVDDWDEGFGAGL